MFALSFFGIIHVPINVPALGAAVKEDNINVNRELIAHGISNTLSGCLGSIQVRFMMLRGACTDPKLSRGRAVVSYTSLRSRGFTNISIELPRLRQQHSIYR
jgi:hypothetical protein